jgi:predicted ATPase
MALHTDYEIRWKHYRAFEDTDWIKIRPVTVLIGANNSGKTSVTSPLLLLDQTFASRDTTTPLVTRGPLVDAGSFKNIIHNHDVTKHLFLGLRYHLHKLSARDPVGKIGSYPPGGIELTMATGKDPENIELREFALFDVHNRWFLRQTQDDKGFFDLESEAFKIKSPKERKAIRESKPINFLFSPSVAFRRLQSQGKKKGERVSVVEPSRGFVTYLNALSACFGELGELFSELTYVGPLREHPKRYYPLSDVVPISVGSRGENMANLVRRRLPELKDKLDEWIRRFEFGDGLEISNLSEEFFSLSFVSANQSIRTNIADAGFGASQVLPLIVQAFAASVGSLTIAEQPEIHLNPHLQYLLADLLVEMANADHRVIVETHSEHLLLRLRRLVADGKIKHDKVAIYFVEKASGISTIRPIDLTTNGHIPSWPRGFFEDSLGESLALAAAQSRNAKTDPAAKPRGGKGC